MHKLIDIGAETYVVPGDDIVESSKTSKLVYKNIISRLRNPFKQDKKGNDVILDDVFLDVREDEQGREYNEWKSPSLGYAYKRMSKATDKKAEYPYFIAFMAPWVRWNKEEECEQVLYTAMQLENSEKGTGELQELGFEAEDAGQWVSAKRVEMGTSANSSDHWVWKPID